MNKNKRDWSRTLNKWLDALGQPLVAVGISFLLGAIVILICGESVFKAYGAMLRGAFGNAFYINDTLKRATPIIMGGLAVCVAWRSGYEAMGGEGQMIFGAFCAAVVGYYLPAPGIVRILVAMLVAIFVGGVYSAFTGWLYEKFDVTFIISTLMLNYIANYIASYLTNYVVKDPTARDINAVQTGKIATEARLPAIFSGSVHWGFIFALLCVILVYIIFTKTTFGYKSRMNGLNPNFALYGGINARKMLYIVLIFSGALAGLGGALQLMGMGSRISVFSSQEGFGFAGIVVALMGCSNAFGVFIAGLFYGALTYGGSKLNLEGVPTQLISVIVGTVVFFIAISVIFERLKFAKNRSEAVKAAKNVEAKK